MTTAGSAFRHRDFKLFWVSLVTEALALQMQALELNNDDERALVEGVFWNAIDCLGEADRRLPQIAAVLPMLKRGVGVHHSGLLPILKEVIEILFQEGLLKARVLTWKLQINSRFE